MPGLRYRNVGAAVAWLSAAFQFTTHDVVRGDDGAILYAELAFGDDMIMIWPVGGSELDTLMIQPDEIGGAETQSCYFVVDDVAAHYDRAKAAGAEIVLEIKQYVYGGVGYSCRDLEGHIWNFGTHNPWQSKAAALSRWTASGTNVRSWRSPALIAAAMLAGVTAGWVGARMLAHHQEGKALATAVTSRDSARSPSPAVLKASDVAELQRQKEAADRAAADARDQFTREQSAKELAELRLRDLEQKLVEAVAAKSVAEQSGQSAAQQFSRDRLAREAARRSMAKLQRDIVQEREAKQRAENALQDALAKLARERGAKEAAERAATEAEDRIAAVLSEKQGGAQSPRLAPGALPKQRSERKSPARSSESPAMSPMPALIP